MIDLGTVYIWIAGFIIIGANSYFHWDIRLCKYLYSRGYYIETDDDTGVTTIGLPGSWGTPLPAVISVNMVSRKRSLTNEGEK